MSWVPGGKTVFASNGWQNCVICKSGKTVSVNGCHYGKAKNFLGEKIKFGGISAGGLTAEAH